PTQYITTAVFLSPLPPPPRSPLFPYTTLFRSSLSLRRTAHPGIPGQDAGAGPGGKCLGPDPERPRPARSDGPALLARAHRRSSGDRKSTRLNSSHVKISYAVFCLKKKKK